MKKILLLLFILVAIGLYSQSTVGQFIGIDATGHVTVPVVFHAYGGFQDSTTTIACGAGDWNHITNDYGTLWTLIEADGFTISGDEITVVNAGDYGGSFAISMSSLNTKDFHIRCYNTTQASVMGVALGISTRGANDEVTLTIPIYVEDNAMDVIRFEISSADGTDPVIEDGVFILTYLHD